MNLRILTRSLLLTTTLSGCYAGAASDLTVRIAPRSLAGTAIDGELRTGPDGTFVFDERARLAFDYFLTADTELPTDDLAAWVRAELDRTLPAPAADEAFAAWESYLAFRSEAATTLAQPTDLAAAERQLLRAVDDHLGDYPIARAERAQISHSFALKRIDTLTGEPRERALAELTSNAPTDDDAQQFLTARQAITAAQLAGADDLQALRSQHYGQEAAARLAALDATRSAWTQRLATHRSAREALRTELTGPALATAITDLETADFSPSELRRLHALDRLSKR